MGRRAPRYPVTNKEPLKGACACCACPMPKWAPPLYPEGWCQRCRDGETPEALGNVRTLRHHAANVAGVRAVLVERLGQHGADELLTNTPPELGRVRTVAAVSRAAWYLTLAVVA